MSRKMIGLGVT